MVKCLHTGVIARTACAVGVGRFRRRKRAVARVERKEKQAINANVSLIDVSNVTPNTRKKGFTARRVERNTQRVEKQAINANVSLTGVSNVTPNTRKKELAARRVERNTQRVKKQSIKASVSLNCV